LLKSFFFGLRLSPLFILGHAIHWFDIPTQRLGLHFTFTFTFQYRRASCTLGHVCVFIFVFTSFITQHVLIC
jgi:hypothetical protein